MKILRIAQICWGPLTQGHMLLATSSVVFPKQEVCLAWRINKDLLTLRFSRDVVDIEEMTMLLHVPLLEF